MASTFTTNAGIELIATGEQSGTWGDTTNVNLQIIDRLTNGVGSITLSGNTHTLTTTDGALSDGQYAVIVFGGAPTGTNTVTISPSDQQKVFLVKNDSGESVVLTQGSGGDVTIANGNAAIVYADGAGAGAAVVDLTAVFPAEGALLAANNLSDLQNAATALVNLGVDATAAELNILDGATVTTTELNYNDITTLGVSEASKVITTDASNDTSIGGSVTATSFVGDGSSLTNLPASGALTLIQEVDVTTNVSSVDLEGMDSTYPMYLVIVSGAILDSGENINGRFKNGGSYDTSNIYDTTDLSTRSGDNTPQVFQEENKTEFEWMNFSSATDFHGGVFWIIDPSNDTETKTIFGHWAFANNDGAYQSIFSGGYKKLSSSAVTGIRLFPGNTEWTSGNFKLFGVGG